MEASLFDPKPYSTYRHLYPSPLFDGLKPIISLLKLEHPGPLTVLDLGAGTGFSAQSFLQFYANSELTLLESDPEMLSTAQEFLNVALSTKAVNHHFVHAQSEKIPLSDSSFDGIIIGSAWHWMKAHESLREMVRVLKPNGFLFIFEYQFPKANEPFLDLNEWIRRQFNLYWRAPEQTPRGTLRELTTIIRNDSHFSESNFIKLCETKSLTREFLTGFIFSQSRFQHYLSSLDQKAAGLYLESFLMALVPFFKSEKQIPFRISYEGFIFRKRVF